MKEYKLFNTDGKTFFDFRSKPESRCEGFTLTYCDDGTVVMSGDYGTLCWKRYGKYPDYGFPNKETNIGYFAEKVCQWGVEQVIEKWDKDKAIEDFKERYKDELEDYEGKDKFEEILEQMNWLEDYDEIKFYELVRDFDNDSECSYKYYTEYFKFIFENLKSVSEQVLDAVNKKKFVKSKDIESNHSQKINKNINKGKKVVPCSDGMKSPINNKKNE
ncbi:hypothetical protein [Lutibacter sp.]|uniref:hypothetical protein n=1 Tax=Lutibacter sp. TaxID=1925666 RepID=UPI0034A01519